MNEVKNIKEARKQVANAVGLSVEEMKKEIRKQHDRYIKQQATLDEAVMLVRELYDTLDVAGKKRFITKHSKTFISFCVISDPLSENRAVFIDVSFSVHARTDAEISFARHALH